MKCPECKQEIEYKIDPADAVFYPLCRCGSRQVVPPTNPPELLWLIETARLTGKFETYGEFIDAIESYLSGDHEPLEKLAGE